MVRRNRLLSVAAPEPTPAERLQHLNNAIEGIRIDDVNKLIATIPLGVDIKKVYHFHSTKPSKREAITRASLLHLSIINKAIGCMKFLLHLGAPIEACESSLGDYPLHSAVRMKYREAIDLLLEYGACPTTSNMRGDTPLHIAAGNGDVRTVINLLQEGAIPYVKNRYDETPEYRAITTGSAHSLHCVDILKTFRK